MDYKDAGVNIEEGYAAIRQYKELAAGTVNAGAFGGLKPLGGIGSFAGMLSLAPFLSGGAAAMEEPVLVSGTDGVGTKLDIAFRMKKYHTVGIDCVAMSVNDILCHGATPLFFLDYIACGKLDADIAAGLVRGVASGCRLAGCILLGGETAEMPGFYDEGKYDIAGFAVGIVDRKKIVDGSKIDAGDTLIGIASSGPHSNGFSLIRKAIPDLEEDFNGAPVGDTLLMPTWIYVKPVLSLMQQIDIHGMAHITGGGFIENIPRMFGSNGYTAHIKKGSWEMQPIFKRIAQGAGLATDSEAMFNTFNMGIGFVLAVSKKNSAKTVEHLAKSGMKAWEIGSVEEGSGGIIIE
jgi:phosphoribosylformylglycinamidine cyclo-ligase